MSHRITQQTEMTNKSLAISAIKSAGLNFREVGDDQLVFTSGSLNNATLNLKTGLISGDSDYGHNKETFGLLRQHYSEAQCRALAAKHGHRVESRKVLQDGRIELICRTA